MFDPVTIRVSEGVPIVEVPDLNGKKGSEATKMLEDLGLVIKAHEFSRGERVVLQDPQPGTSVEKGTTVQVLLD